MSFLQPGREARLKAVDEALMKIVFVLLFVLLYLGFFGYI